MAAYGPAQIAAVRAGDAVTLTLTLTLLTLTLTLNLPHSNPSPNPNPHPNPNPNLNQVTYDASVLHYGTANAVEGNDRMVLYFSVARAGAAAASFAVASEESPPGLDAVDPIQLSSYSMDRADESPE